MVRSRRLLIIRQVARYAGSRKCRVLAVDVAGRTGDGRMFAGQRELGRAVIEGPTEPLNSGVAGLARLGESRDDMVRIRRCREVLRMAAGTRRYRPLIVAAHVARGTLYRRMSPGELELRELVVIETRQLPVIHAVAGLAPGGKAGGPVIHAFGLLELLLVAIDALRA